MDLLNGSYGWNELDCLRRLVRAAEGGTLGEYETIAAGQSNITLGGTGAAGDLFTGMLVIPATTSPGAITISDGGGLAITVFTGGAASVSNLVPFFIPITSVSNAGAWTVTTGANVSVICYGNFA